VDESARAAGLIRAMQINASIEAASFRGIIATLPGQTWSSSA
jgi:hypothetical protein